ncbi:basic amino acid ABC transporter substrate-binding protein [Paenibacillus thailandensis]|uniref:Basic amino acid ABC transporter substrate-binding protein n=1 Tax=Paenibacillus thailandensis TaxID=393250 RepID=A0ABW5QZI1_9BACL
MKKGIMLVFLTLIMAIVAGCGAKTNESAGGGFADGEQAKVYKIATDASYAPMEMMDKDKIVGFDIDFLAEVMKEAGLSYEVVNTGWDPLMTSLESASSEFAGAISAISITDERKQTYDFSFPYYESTNMIVSKEGSGIASALDLKGKKVAVQGGTTADELMTDIMGEGNTDLKKFDNNTLALMELENGGAEAVVADIAIIREYLKNNPDAKLEGVLDKENFGVEYYGVMFPKGGELKAKLDPAIKTVIENGKYAEVYKKWFGEEPDTKALLDQMN